MFVNFAFFAGTRPPTLFQQCRSLSGHTVLYNSAFHQILPCPSLQNARAVFVAAQADAGHILHYYLQGAPTSFTMITLPGAFVWSFLVEFEYI